MALSDEQMKRLITQADALAQKEGSVFRVLVKLTEAEVRAQHAALIRQMLEAIEADMEWSGGSYHKKLDTAAAAARAWLEKNQ